METPQGAPEWIEVFTAQERPDLWEQAQRDRTFDQIWPEYNLHGTHAGRYFGALYPRHAHLQALLVDRRSEHPAARARTIPIRWDGTLDDLPAGIDAAGLRAVQSPEGASALSALAAEILPTYQGMNLSGLVIDVMARLARSANLAPLVAPVRPNWKDRYPLVPIAEYAVWTRPDGLPFDPWMRVHTRLGAEILRVEPRSMEISAPISKWEAWTDMRFPAGGSYVFPGGLAPLFVSRGIGHYWEPNVWMLHDVGVMSPIDESRRHEPPEQ